MIISHTKDMALVKKLMTSDGIWENISSEGQDRDTFEPIPSWQYVVGEVDGSPIGLGVIHKLRNGLNKCHVQVLPKHRKEYGIKFGLDGMKFIWANNTFDKMVASIPSKFPNVRKFAEVMGFKLIKETDQNEWLFEAKRR